MGIAPRGIHTAVEKTEGRLVPRNGGFYGRWSRTPTGSWPATSSGRFRCRFRAAWRERTARLRQQLGLDNDFEALIYQEPGRADASGWLTGHGWQVDEVDSHDEMARLGRRVPDDLVEDAVASTLVRARLGAQS